MKGIVIDIISAAPERVNIIYDIPDGVFEPVPGFYRDANRDPNQFPADVIKIWDNYDVYFRPRDGLYEVLDQNEHEAYSHMEAFYEQRFGRMHRMVNSGEIASIANKYNVLRGTNLPPVNGNNGGEDGDDGDESQDGGSAEDGGSEPTSSGGSDDEDEDGE